MDIMKKYKVSECDDGKAIVKSNSETDKVIEIPTVENPIIVNGVWYVDQFPTMIIIELESGELKRAHITPLAPLALDKLLPYRGYHPRKMKGNPVPEFLFKFYGLEKNAESMSEVFRVRVTPTEKAKFEAYCASLEPNQSVKKPSVSDVLREFVRSKI